LLTKRDGIEAARHYLQEAQAAEGDEPDTKTALILVEAQILRNANALDEALNLLSQAVDSNPEAADLFYDRAMVAEKLNRLDLFEADLRRVIQLKPDQANAYNALGYTLADRNVRLMEAYELIQTAIGISPDDASIRDSLGWVQFRLGQLKEAKATLNAAYQTRQDPEIAAHLGEVLWALGQQEEARKLWQNALQESPGNDALTSIIEKYRH
ncbi:MAG: tetratricopeptide repeat protein, partial [Betaproteobacteria bacterium]|nr:tetratricopeptide repeat protein [Betaproteobacteria bacterium]